MSAASWPGTAIAGHQKTPKTNIEACLHTLEAFHGAHDIIEIRVLRPGNQTDAGYFCLSSERELRAALRAIPPDVKGTYFVINKIDPKLLGRAHNRIKRAEQTTKDTDIIERRWLFIDADVQLPAGVSASNNEHDTALARATRIREHLAELGFPDPIFSNSGNGAHLFYRLPPAFPLTPEGDALIKDCLAALAAQFDDDAIKIDLNTANRSRIAKLYGTVARKGDDTTERPHRLATILEEPERAEPVPLDLLEALAAAAPQKPPAAKSITTDIGDRPHLDVDGWLAKHGISIRNGPEPHPAGGRKWTLAACPFNPEHDKSGPALIQYASGALQYKCFHQSCSANGWRQYRNHFEPDNTRTHTADPGNARAQRQEQQASRVDISKIPPIRSFNSSGIEFVVPGLIASGAVTMFSGESGHGKSTLVTALAAAIANGTEFAGRLCSQRQVLLLDRENGIDVLQERFERLGINDERGLIVWGSWLENEAPAPACPTITDWVTKQTPKPVVIIDSAIAFLNGNENSANEVREFMSQLRRIANLGAPVVLLHHTGKAETAQDYRGSSDFKGAIDVGINIRNTGEGELGKIVLKAFKSRFSIDRELVLNYRNGHFTCDTRPNAVSRTVTEQLNELLRNNPGVKTAEFEKLGQHLGRQRARNYLTVGLQAGEIRTVKGPRNARLHYLNSHFSGSTLDNNA